MVDADTGQVTVELCGETLRVEAMDAEDFEAPMLRYSEAMDSGEQVRQMAAVMRLLRSVIVDDDHPKIDALLDRKQNRPRFADVDNAVGEAMRAATGRPTQPSLPSTDGPSTVVTGSRVVSLSRGTAGTEPQSPQDGRSAAG